MRADGDAQYTVAAAASVARLTHSEATPVANACLAALVLKDALDSADLRLDGDRWSALAQKWGGAPSSEKARRAALDLAGSVRTASDDGAAARPELAALGFE